MNLKDTVSITCGVVGSLISGMFGGWTQAMTTLCIFMAGDYITGLLVAGVWHKSPKSAGGGLESDYCWKGLLKKGVTLGIVLIAYRLDLTLDTTYIKDAVIIAYCVNEGLSILENVGLMGVEYPPVIKKAFEVLNKNESE